MGFAAVYTPFQPDWLHFPAIVLQMYPYSHKFRSDVYVFSGTGTSTSCLAVNVMTFR